MRKFSYDRSVRLGELIRQELAFIIQKDFKDPRLGIVTLTEVKVSKDFSYAKIYILVLGDATRQTQSVEVLNHAAGFFRTELSKRLSTRIVPQLKFFYDVKTDGEQRVTHLMDELASKIPPNPPFTKGGRGDF